MKKWLIPATAFALLLPTHPAAGKDLYRIEADVETFEGSHEIHVTATAHYAAKTELIWKIINQIDAYPKRLPRFLSAHAKVINEKSVVAKVEIDIPWPLQNVRNSLRIILDQPAGTFQWRRISGNMKKNEGTLTLKPDGENTALSLDLRADPGVWIPKWLLRWGIRSYVPDLLGAVGKWAEEENRRPSAFPKP